MTRLVSVVIPARNDAAGLPSAVESVLAQRGCAVEQVLLCIGPSADDTERVAQGLAHQYEQVRVLQNEHGGISQGLNLGLAHTTTDILVRCDARCRLPDGYIVRALETMDETGAANVGAVQVPVGNTVTQRAIARAMRHRLGSGGAEYRTGTTKKRVKTAFLGVFQTAALRAVGGWDDAFARNEDAELNARLASNGHDVWLDPDLRVDYLPRPTFRTLARQYWDYGQWRRHTAAKHRTSVQVRQLVAPLMVLTLIISVLLAVLMSPAFLLIPLAYLAVLGLVALTLPRQISLAERVRVPIALLTMHLCWGAGFLRSLATRGITSR